jgi:hypothetical protein
LGRRVPLRLEIAFLSESAYGRDAFVNAFAVVAALCFGIIIVSLFFMLLNYVNKAISGRKVVKLKGFIKDAALVNIHLIGGKTLEQMKFVGFTDGPSPKGNIPFQLRNRVVLENAKGLRILLKADSIKMIEEVEPSVLTTPPE